MAIFKAVVLSSTNQLRQDGMANIKIRIYHNNSTQYISTPHYISKIQISPRMFSSAIFSILMVNKK
ncbi:Arm DNA-binding domain-containing protein [Parabacteroides sp. Marseille-P3160]|uniref:Arm DNA-binding domain-containing protein n=1 Tax=Parabacteroides sp. Marseille-P3160 TaxID=1917887 RepID=UPI001119E6BD|nr:Arm DNA-binding domain-containing protein [Parabacteroides sp. Marseille-P3160]